MHALGESGVWGPAVLVGLLFPLAQTGARAAPSESSQGVEMMGVLVSTVHIPFSVFDTDDPAAWSGPIATALEATLAETERPREGYLGVTLFPDRDAEFVLCCQPPCGADLLWDLTRRLDSSAIPRTRWGEFGFAVGFRVNKSGDDGVQRPPNCPYEFPREKRAREFGEMNLHGQRNFLVTLARDEMLPVLGLSLTEVDPQFEGVRTLGHQLMDYDQLSGSSVAALTDSSFTYWRARVEMAPQNASVVTARILLHLRNGEIDRATRLLKHAQRLPREPSLASDYFDELVELVTAYLETRRAWIERGVAYFDGGDASAADSVYRAVLEMDPSSAWAWHEHFLTRKLSSEAEVMQNLDEFERDYADRVYGADPLYPMGIVARHSGVYRLLLRFQAAELFAEPDAMAADMLRYADIALDLDEFGFAAELYWVSLLFIEDSEAERAIDGFLYCLERLGVTEMKANFVGDHEARFVRVEAAKRAREASSMAAMEEDPQD